MPVNEFLSFALGPGENVLDQTTYASLSDRTTGFQPGIAKSANVNKVLRQSSAIATMIAQFIVDKAAVDVNDDGDLATLEAHFISALEAVGGGGGSGTGVAALPILKTANYTASSGDFIIADTSAVAFAITLPASPVVDTTILRVTGNFSAHNLTIDGNGHSWFGGISDPYVLDADLLDILIVFTTINAVNGWLAVG